ncbi:MULTISPECIES: hypothetical protein [Allobaculum]|uniref:hypothetical protein n=1 Tax=Allobaculum TaxID=174708 RepID=UPI001E512B92|nr:MULTISPECIES: hypothetical protein [Allobaculum]UNT92224.1 hypothetical protein KWG61_08295 [Allobaculum sp. Allo2]
MANEKDREALMLQEKYESMATPGAISYSHEPSGSGKAKESVYLEIFSDQLEAERKAAQYRFEAEQIKKFIDQIEDEAKEIMIRAYINGERYWKIGESLNYSKDGIRSKIDRCLSRVPSSLAEASGLI